MTALFRNNCACQRQQYQQINRALVFHFNRFNAALIGKNKNLFDFDKCQIDMARKLVRKISKQVCSSNREKSPTGDNEFASPNYIDTRIERRILGQNFKQIYSRRRKEFHYSISVCYVLPVKTPMLTVTSRGLVMPGANVIVCPQDSSRGPIGPGAKKCEKGKHFKYTPGQNHKARCKRCEKIYNIVTLIEIYCEIFKFNQKMQFITEKVKILSFLLNYLNKH